MERNVGRRDRIVRVLGGLVLVLAALSPFAGFLPIPLGNLLWFAIPGLLVLLGVLLLVTGATGRSIVYHVFGFETYSPPDEEVEPGAER